MFDKTFILPHLIVSYLALVAFFTRNHFHAKVFPINTLINTLQKLNVTHKFCGAKRKQTEKKAEENANSAHWKNCEWLKSIWTSGHFIISNANGSNGWRHFQCITGVSVLLDVFFVCLSLCLCVVVVLFSLLHLATNIPLHIILLNNSFNFSILKLRTLFIYTIYIHVL